MMIAIQRKAHVSAIANTNISQKTRIQTHIQYGIRCAAKFQCCKCCHSCVSSRFPSKIAAFTPRSGCIDSRCTSLRNWNHRWKGFECLVWHCRDVEMRSNSKRRRKQESRFQCTKCYYPKLPFISASATKLSALPYEIGPGPGQSDRGEHGMDPVLATLPSHVKERWNAS